VTTVPAVRTARPGDAPALFALQSELDRRSPDLLRAGLSGVGTLLVSPAGEGTTSDGPAGYLLAVPGEEGVHVAELAVAPDHRREGRASALLRALFERAGDREVTIAVEPENEAARACYGAVGFEVRERDPAYFDGDPALVLVR
jgi:ribosomal-protein-alanine N-acetyltransferase